MAGPSKGNLFKVISTKSQLNIIKQNYCSMQKQFENTKLILIFHENDHNRNEKIFTKSYLAEHYFRR